MKIKDFAEMTGYSIRMLRYLEEVGLIVPLREGNNYRVYKEEQVGQAKWIKQLQDLGIQLKEIEQLQNFNSDDQIKLLKNVLLREQEVAELKSETIPELKEVIDYLVQNKSTLQAALTAERKPARKMKTTGGEEKFQRTAFSIPILKSIYEDHITHHSDVELIATDLMKFLQWVDNIDYAPDVFSILNESSFVFGKNLTDKFLQGYEEAWSKFLPAMGFQKLEEFLKADVQQLMGPHDIVIRTTFKLNESGLEGEIVIPYTPIYTMSQLSKLT